MKHLSIIILTLSIGLASCESDESAADAFGTFEATEIYLSAEVPGKLIQITKDEGDEVVPNEMIALIDTTQLYLKKEQLKATKNALKSKLQNVPVQLEVFYEQKRNMEREVNRIKALLADSAATSKQLDDLSGQLSVVTSQIAATESQLSTANRGILAEIHPLDWQIAQVEDQLNRSKIIAPIKGTVLKKYKEASELINPGQPVLKIADLSTIELKAYISESQLSSFKINDEVTVQADRGENLNQYKGKITWISPKAEFTPKIIQTREERVNLVYAIKIQVKNDGSLKIGMPGEVIFKSES
tara:strand:+ start:939 stop:1841 length:903 start_codon:yes stop_codon:yes gene_type:complete